MTISSALWPGLNHFVAHSSLAFAQEVNDALNRNCTDLLETNSLLHSRIKQLEVNFPFQNSISAKAVVARLLWLYRFFTSLV